MSGYDWKYSIKEEHIERQYFSNTYRINLLALTTMVDDKYPWEYQDWAQNYPKLSKFLSYETQDYGETEEDYFELLKEYRHLVQKDKWVLESVHESLNKNLSTYMFGKPKKIKHYIPHISLFILGLIIGNIFASV